MYVRHSAWLSAVPEKHQDDKSKVPNVSRRKALERNGIDKPEMPECDALYIVGYLFEIGPVLGEGPITQGEIQAWQFNMGITLDAWEVRFLKRLSIEYLDASYAALKPDATAPWADAPYALSSVEMAAKRMKESIREMAQL